MKVTIMLVNIQCDDGLMIVHMSSILYQLLQMVIICEMKPIRFTIMINDINHQTLFQANLLLSGLN